MNESDQPSYYAIIPSEVRYCEELKYAERLLYGEITALTNKEGYCFATNRYFAELYNVIPGTILRWINHLETLGFIRLEIIKDEKNQIIERRIYIKEGMKNMQKEILTELEDLRDETEFIINNEENIENKHIENYLRSLERIRYNLFNKFKLNNKYEINEQDKITYLHDRYKATVENGILKIYIPEVIPKYKNINNYAYKNIMINVMEKTKEYKDLFNNQLVFVFIKVVENQKNIDIDNKFVKPIIDGLVLSKVIEDDNIANMFYGVFGTTDTNKKPYTEVYVLKGKGM